MKLAQEPQMSLRRNLLLVRWQAKVQTFVYFYMAVLKLRAWWRWSSWGEMQQGCLYLTDFNSGMFRIYHDIKRHAEQNKLLHFMKKWPKLSLLSLRPEWYGMLYSQADSKKKSNLMLSVFDPGAEPLPWLGKISHLGPVSGKSITPPCVYCRQFKKANSRFSTNVIQTTAHSLCSFFITEGIFFWVDTITHVQVNDCCSWRAKASVCVHNQAVNN